MAIRALVNVATGPHYARGQQRLRQSVIDNGACGMDFNLWNNEPHTLCPPHDKRPYAFKAYALELARTRGAQTLLWCDASIYVNQPMEPLFERIERDGYWISRNGWTNYEWTADSAYPALFSSVGPEAARRANGTIPHVVATAFGLSMRHGTGRAILEEYFRLASETDAFCGPWVNTPETPCGPPDVRGHRHDQTALSVIAWRLGCQLTDPPDIFAYAKTRDDGTFHREDQDPRTILIARGI